MKRSANIGGVSQSKLDHIKSGTTKKTQLGGEREKKKVIEHKGGKFHVTETEKKFEEAGVSRKKRNYVMYESKLGTEKERDTTKITAKKMKKPQPRVLEKIVMEKKRREILDNYQYHESKVMKEPQNASYVFHQRLSKPIGGAYETKTYERKVYKMNDGNLGRPSSTQTRTINTQEKQSSTSSRNRPKINVSNTQTFNRNLKNQPGQYNTLTASRNKRPIITKAVTSETKFKRISRNSNVRTDYENSNSQRGRLPNILKDTENTFPLKEVEKKEHFRNKSPENADIKETVINIQKETKTEATQPINENDVLEYKKVLKKTITDNNGKTTTTTKTTIEKAGNERPKRRRFKH